MKAYIAYSYKTHPKIIEKIFWELQNVKIQSFFPESIELSAISLDEMKYVDKICCDKIRESNILVAVYPFGLSVSIEIGRFLELKNINKDENRMLIIFDTSPKDSDIANKLRSEAMIIPHVDAIVTTIDQLLKTLKIYTNDNNDKYND